MASAAAALSMPNLGRRLDDLGLAGLTSRTRLNAARAALDSADLVSAVDQFADRLRGGMGDFPGDGDSDPWAGYQPDDDPLGPGVLPLLALVATADDLAAFHRRREIPPAISRQTLTELGQQVWVHRLTFGGFGLHTYGWMTVTWSGSLYWLGRLQFNLMRLDGEWVCSTHIPRSGALDPAAVDDSFAGPPGSFRALRRPCRCGTSGARAGCSTPSWPRPCRPSRTSPVPAPLAALR